MRSVVLGGFMGCGKTSVGRLLAEKLDRAFLDTDEVTASLAGESIHGMLAAGRLADVRRWEREACERLAGREDLVIATGGGVLTSAENAALLHRRGVLVYITRSFDALYPVIAADPVRTLAYRRSYGELKALCDGRTPLYTANTDFSVPNDASPELCAEEILRILRERGELTC